MYDQLFREVPDHPQLTRKASRAEQAEAVSVRVGLLERFLRPDTVFMEIGAGDCALAASVARRVQHVYAVDVSDEITRDIRLPSNVHLIVCKGCCIPVPNSGVDLAFSYQLVEHLHQDDVSEHLESVHRALKPRGRYVLVTPNRLNGPHDISKYFAPEAQGFHMKEYTTIELARVLRAAGFSSVRAVVGARGHFVPIPPGVVGLLERVIDALPAQRRARVAALMFVRQLLGVMMVARK